MDADSLELLMAVTESSATKCRQALVMAHGDTERAMALLLDGVVDAIGVDADISSFAGSFVRPPAPRATAVSPSLSPGGSEMDRPTGGEGGAGALLSETRNNAQELEEAVGRHPFQSGCQIICCRRR